MSEAFENYSIGTKVTLIMIAIFIAAVGLGWFSERELGVVNRNAGDIRDNWLPSTRALGDLSSAVTRARAAESSSLLQDYASGQENMFARAHDFEKDVKAAFDQYLPMVSSEEERVIANRIQAGWAAYRPMYETAIAKLKGEGRQAAAAYFNGPMRDNYDSLYTLINQDIHLNHEGGVAAANRSEQSYRRAQYLILMAVIATLCLCGLATWVMRAGVANPITKLTDSMSALSSGRLDAEVPYAGRQDEVGVLASGMLSFRDQLAAAESAKAEQTRLIVSSIGTGLDNLSKGDLTHRIEAELTGPFAKLKGDFNATVTHLDVMVHKILGASNQIAAGAGEIDQATIDLSRRTEQQAASLEETAAALDEIAATMKKTARNTHEVTGAIKQATGAANDGGTVVETAIQAMDAIAQSSREITDIIGVIDEIAFQTNLLALNAGVEAARAGDAGKGFAVVASEVRALAGRSGEAAKQIKSLITNSGTHVGAGVRLVGETGEALKKIVEQIHHIGALVGEMSGAAEQQSAGVQEVNTAIGQMDQVTQKNAAMVEESTAASRSLAHQTEELQQLVSFFKVDMRSAAAVPSGTAQPKAKAQRTPLLPPAASRRTAAAVAFAERKATDAEWSEF